MCLKGNAHIWVAHTSEIGTCHSCHRRVSREIVESQDHFGWKTLECTELNRKVNLAPDHVPVISAALHMASCPNPSPTWCPPLDTFIPFLYCAIHPVLINGAGAARWLGPGRHDTPAKHGTPARSSPAGTGSGPSRIAVPPRVRWGALAAAPVGGAGAAVPGTPPRGLAPRYRACAEAELRLRASARRPHALPLRAGRQQRALRPAARAPRSFRAPPRREQVRGGRDHLGGRGESGWDHAGPRQGGDKGAGGFVAGVCVRGEGGSGPR